MFSTAYSPIVSPGNGSATVIPVTWPFFTGSLKVTNIDATGVETLLTLGTHYTVTGGTDANGIPSTGSVTMVTAPATGTSTRIERVTPRTQMLSFVGTDPFPAKAIEQALDKLTLFAQEAGYGGSGSSGLALTLNTSGAVDYYDAGNYPIRNLPTPVNASDAATKGYIDTTASSVATNAATASNAATTATNAATTASNAATTASNAATTASNAATTATNAAAAAAAASETPVFTWKWSTSTAAADPGSTFIRLNNATLASVTAMYVSETAIEGDVSGFMNQWGASSSTIKGYVILRKPQAANTWAVFSFTAAPTDNGAWRTLALTFVAAGAGAFADNDTVSVFWMRNGDAGTGAVISFNGRTGVVTPAANDYAVTDISGLVAALSGKSDTGHTHVAANVTISVTQRMVGRNTAGAGAGEEITASQVLDWIGNTRGGVLFRGASAWTLLAPGTAGQFLQSGGTGADPAWAGLSFATSAEYRIGTDSVKPLNVANVWGAKAAVTLTDAATIALDLSTGIDFVVTLAGNRTLGNPTNPKVGQSGRIRVIQDATGSRLLTYGTNYKFAGGSAPTLTTAANAKDHLYYEVIDATNIFISPMKDIK